MIAVGQQGPIIFPVGPGIGATHDRCAVASIRREAGIPQIIVVAEPFTIIPGPAGTHAGSMQGNVVSVIRAAGRLPIITVGAPLMIISGSGGCGTGVGVGAGG